MPFRFRKSFKISKGLKINLSKSGLSTSLGKKGLSLNLGKRGIRLTSGIPGTGISNSGYIVKESNHSNRKAKKDDVSTEEKIQNLESSSSAPPKPNSPYSPRTRKTINILIITIPLLCLICILFGMFLNAVSPATSTTQPLATHPAPTVYLSPVQSINFTPYAFTPLPTLPPPPNEQLRPHIQETHGTGNPSLPRLTQLAWADTDQSLYIQWALNDNLTLDLITTGAQKDITDMLNTIVHSSILPNYQIITFVGTFPLKDSYGNTAEENVITASYNRTTIDRINWQGFLFTDVFTIAHVLNIHPAMLTP
jgi:hypothetical protein